MPHGPDTPELANACDMLREIYWREYGRGWRDAIANIKRVLNAPEQSKTAPQAAVKYPHEFLGRCPSCLDNAYLDGTCFVRTCQTPDFPLGVPDHECILRTAQARYRHNQDVTGKTGTLRLKD